MLESDTRGSVIISNAAKHHSFEAAKAAVEAGMLKRFITGIYYSPRRRSDVMAAAALSWLAPNAELRLRLHGDPELDPFVKSMTLVALFREAAQRSTLLRGTRLSTTVGLIYADYFDRNVAQSCIEPCDIFHAFESCALHSFERAQELGATLVLDQPVMHIDALRKSAAEECERIGISVPKDPPLYDRAVERKYRELAMADWIVTGLDFVKRTLIANGVAESKIRVIPYGVDSDGMFQPIERSKRNELTILYVGALTWYKGLPNLLDVFAHLQLPQARLVVIGREHAGWGDYFQNRFAAMPNVEWIPGVPRSELARWYAKADVLVFPSLVGGVGLVVYEAMSTGLPVIVSDGDVVIRDGIDGLVAPVNEPGTLAAAITRIHEDHELRHFLGKNAISRAQQFRWQNYRTKLIEMYQGIIDQRRSVG